MLVITNIISSANIAEWVLVVESHFKSFSTKITSKIQSGNVFFSCFHLISQDLIVHNVLRKYFVRPNRQRGLNLGVLNQLGKNPDLLSVLFTRKDQHEEVVKVLQFDTGVSEKIKELLNRFQKCTESKLQQYLLFVTA